MARCGPKIVKEIGNDFVRQAGEAGIERATAEAALKVHGFRSSEASSEHNWQEDPSGGSYLSRLSARYGPSIQERLELFKREKLEPALEKEISARGAGRGNQASSETLNRRRGGRLSPAVLRSVDQEKGGIIADDEVSEAQCCGERPNWGEVAASWLAWVAG
jgi:hypothetical protein